MPRAHPNNPSCCLFSSVLCKIAHSRAAACYNFTRSPSSLALSVLKSRIVLSNEATARICYVENWEPIVVCAGESARICICICICICIARCVVLGSSFTSVKARRGVVGVFLGLPWLLRVRRVQTHQSEHAAGGWLGSSPTRGFIGVSRPVSLNTPAGGFTPHPWLLQRTNSFRTLPR